MNSLPSGIYERLLDEDLRELLDAKPELRPVLRALDDESAPHAYAQLINQLLVQALRITAVEQRIPLLNRIIELLSSTDGLDYLARKRLLRADKSLLTAIGAGSERLPRPQTPLATSTLLTGLGHDPPLEHELRAEMATADRVDILISFIKWSGLRLLMPAFERLAERKVPIRILSTSYMGASDPTALEWLAQQPNISVRVSYDTGGTRLHAKAYHFVRESGYSTAYIGSANMSHAAMTLGLEWTVKVTAQDMPQILARFVAEFSAYWESLEFESYEKQDFHRFRQAIAAHQARAHHGTPFFAEITPRPFQLRILEALDAARQRGSRRNLIVSATGTGKTVISALDYRRHSEAAGRREPLLFVVHRKEILEQALGCFRTVLRDQNFGELWANAQEPSEYRHVFASVQTLNHRQPWNRLGADHFRYIIVDEAHHGTASSYRALFDHLQPEMLLGLTATPERMDGSSILPDFDDQPAAEIRLPEALEEKLLCPFHYFGVSDSIDLSDDQLWRNGRYDRSALDNLFTGDDFRARQRVDTILQALQRYQPDLSTVRAVGFCAGVKHARYMANQFNRAGYQAAELLGDTPIELRAERLRAFRDGQMPFLFTVDVLSEGVDVPEINLVMFLRPTESLTVFLQQLGRGLRHAPEKDCLTVLDFVGQTHRRYRLDTKFTALLSNRRQRIDREIENDFPSLPPGCSIQLERVAREQVLNKIRAVLNHLNHFIPETIQTWHQEMREPLTFGRFIEATGLSPIQVLAKHSWSEWKALATRQAAPADPDLAQAKKALARIVLRTDPAQLAAIEELSKHPDMADPAARDGEARATALHYLLWGKKAEEIGVQTLAESLAKWRANPSVAADAAEIAAWRRTHQAIPLQPIELPFDCDLQRHGAYGLAEIKAALGLASIHQTGPVGQGVIHAGHLKAYIHLVTFQKDDRDFSPTTRYRDYPISPSQLHWESQSTATQDSATGQNYIHFQERGYTVLFFARLQKRIDGETAPFLFLGPAKSLLAYQGERPIQMTWELRHPMPAALFEEARPA
ncbi:DUF3427 domain-containing protein [Thiocystis violascens]|uniref:DNA/RNA helicase, superfamily II n=1 Tax=Thiocystis violascens (strain ATCC 17096 / DSM 198 / 6111) TaxID=765911 RepID=I3YG07_THIV6|nr:DEAD/DEAH box helicase [Thiocystis violascens]AFL75925.1 DNA/RNA helicase, superfamily II [Thiocystis violascens DSM 198]